MGYSYESSSGRLCCDRCDHAGGVRRVPCPYGYCQAVALCADCRKDPELRASLRAHCEKHCRDEAAWLEQRDAKRAAVLASGGWVRSSAIGEDTADGRTVVRVTFENAAGETRELLVSRESYHAIPLLEVATPADYRPAVLWDPADYVGAEVS